MKYRRGEPACSPMNRRLLTPDCTCVNKRFSSLYGAHMGAPLRNFRNPYLIFNILLYLFFKPVKVAFDTLFAAAEKFGDDLLDFGEHSDSVGGVRRKLPEVVSAEGVALDDFGAVGSCRNVPAYIADLRSYLCSLEHHLYRVLNKGNCVAL